MNKWFYRAVGTVGIAGGFFLLGGGAAHADQADARPATDPQQLRGALDVLFTPLADKPVAAPPVLPLAAPPVFPLAAPPVFPLAAPPVFPLADVPTDRMGATDVVPSALLGAPPPGSPAERSAVPLSDQVTPLAGNPLTGNPLTGDPLTGAVSLVDAPLADTPLADAVARRAADPVAGVNPLGDQPLVHGLPLAGTPLGDLALAGTPLGDLPLHGLPAGDPLAGLHRAAPAALDSGDLTGHPGFDAVPAAVRPTVRTGSVGTSLPVAGPVTADSRGGTVVPSLIGDAMTQRRPDLFDPAGLLDTGSLGTARGSSHTPRHAAPDADQGALPADLPLGQLPRGDLPHHGAPLGLPTPGQPTLGQLSPDHLPVGEVPASRSLPRAAAHTPTERPVASEDGSLF